MVHHDYKLVFIHLTKCAGSSIVRTLDFHPVDGPGGGHHAEASYIKQVVGDKIWNEYFKFTVVRNPYSKMVSLYRYASPTYLPGSTFSEFIKCWGNGGFQEIGPDHSYLPYLDENIDFVGKLEDGLQNILDLVCDKVSIPRVEVLHVNKTFDDRQCGCLESYSHYTEYYDDETREIVAKGFKDELVKFNYQFGD